MSNHSPTSFDRISQTAQKILDFKNLSAGWHYQEGNPPTSDTVNKALRLNDAARDAGFKQTNAFPGIEGEIVVTAYHESIYLEMTIEPDGLITFIYEVGKRELENQRMTLDQALSRISKFRGITWILLDLSTLDTTTQIEESSNLSHLSLPAMGVAFQSSIQTVLSEIIEISASTSNSSIQESQDRPQYSGIYQSNLYLLNAS